MAIATLGPGDWSIDHTLGISDDLMGWAGFWIASGLGIGAGLLQLVLFFVQKNKEISNLKLLNGLPVSYVTGFTWKRGVKGVVVPCGFCINI